MSKSEGTERKLAYVLRIAMADGEQEESLCVDQLELEDSQIGVAPSPIGQGRVAVHNAR